MTASEIEKILHTEDRRYWQIEANGFCCSHIAPDWSVRDEFVPYSDGDVLSKVMLFDHHYSLMGTNCKDRPPIQYENFLYHDATGPIQVGWGLKSRYGKMTFRVPEPNFEVLVKIELLSENGAVVTDVCSGRQVVSRGKREVVSLKVKSTTEKMVNLTFLGSAHIGLCNLTIERCAP